MLLQSIDLLRKAGAEVVMAPDLLPVSFLDAEKAVNTGPYRRDGASQWLAAYGPAEYTSIDAYKSATGHSLPPVFTGVSGSLDDLVDAAAAPAPATPPPAAGARRGADRNRNLPPQRVLHDDPDAQKNYFGPRDAMLQQYTDALNRFHLDGLVYPTAQMPPPDETMPQDGRLSGGPHSETGWVNKIGVPAIALPAGYYPTGLPFGLEISARPWRDGDLLGWAYGWEQSTKLRRPPVLVDSGLTTAGPYKQ